MGQGQFIYGKGDVTGWYVSGGGVSGCCCGMRFVVWCRERICGSWDGRFQFVIRVGWGQGWGDWGGRDSGSVWVSGWKSKVGGLLFLLFFQLNTKGLVFMVT